MGVFFRHDLMVFGFNLFLKRQFAKPISCESVHWEDGKIIAKGLSFADDDFHLTMDQLEVECNFSFSHLYFEPHLNCIHPELTFVHRSQSSPAFSLASLVPSRFFGIQLEVQNGVLQLNTQDQEQRLYFTFKRGKEENALGTLYLSHDPSLYLLPTIELSLALQEKEFIASLKVAQMESCRLLQLLSFFYPTFHEGWENAQGEVEMMVSGTFDSKLTFSRLAGLIDAQHLYLSNPSLGVKTHVKALHGEFTFPQQSVEQNLPFWKQIRASATVEEGAWFSGSWGVADINAHLLLDPALDPLLDLNGTWFQGTEQFLLSMQGKGCVHQDQTFWLELGIVMTPPDDEPSDALVTICSSEKENYVFQTEVKHCKAGFFEMLGLKLPITKGSFDGKFTGWVTGNKITRMQIDDLQGSNLCWALPEWNTTCLASELIGEALFVCNEKNEWQILSLKGEIPKIDFTCDTQRGSLKLPSFKVAFSGEETSLSALFIADSEKMETHFDYLKNEGWFRMEQLTEAIYAPLLDLFDPLIRLEGSFDLFGTFNEDKLFLSLQGAPLILDHPEFTLQLEEMLQPALFTYRFKEEKWRGSFEIHQVNLIEKRKQLLLENGSASCEIDGSNLLVKGIALNCEGITFAGEMQIDLESQLVTLTSKQMQGPIAPLAKLFDWKIPFTGDFTSDEEGLTLLAHQGKVEWKLQTSLQNVAVSLTDDLAIEEGGCGLTFDSHASTLVIQNAEAKLLFKGKPYHFVGNAKKKEWWEFDVKVTDEGHEVGRAVGIAQQRPPAELHFALEKNKTHLLGMKLSVNRLIIKDWTELLALEMTPLFIGEMLPGQLSFLESAGLIPFKQLPWEIQGEVQARITFEEQLAFELSSPLLKIAGQSFPQCLLKGKRNAGTWEIETLQTAGYSASARFSETEQALHCSFLNLEAPDLTLTLEGDYCFRKRAFSGYLHKMQLNLPGLAATTIGGIHFDPATSTLKGELSLNVESALFQAQSGGKMQAFYSPGSGLSLEGLDLFVQHRENPEATGQCLVEKLTYESQAWASKKIQFQLSKELIALFAPGWSEWLPSRGVAEMEYLPLTSILKATCKTTLQEMPLYLQLQLDHSRELLGMLKISDLPKNPGIKSYFKSKFDWESIKGAITGLEVDLAKTSRETLSGAIKCDFTSLAKFLPLQQRSVIEKLKLGAGYELDGDLDLSLGQFKGALKGSDFELMGFRFKQLQALIQWSAREGVITQCALDDPAGHLFIKQLYFNDEGSWHCHAPLVYLRDFQPTRMQEIVAKGEKKIKPLIFKRVSIYDLDGVLHDLASFTARGQLHFTNMFKKEFSILEVPLEMIKTLGLDPGLFTPIYGEVDFQLRQEKVFLTQMTNTYSEGRRSEFFLQENGVSFLDLDGNLNFNFRMRQHVVLNLTEPFTLTVRGNLEKPKYNLVR
jgi:hypothetical protein